MVELSGTSQTDYEASCKEIITNLKGLVSSFANVCTDGAGGIVNYGAALADELSCDHNICDMHNLDRGVKKHQQADGSLRNAAKTTKKCMTPHTGEGGGAVCGRSKSA